MRSDTNASPMAGARHLTWYHWEFVAHTVPLAFLIYVAVLQRPTVLL